MKYNTGLFIETVQNYTTLYDHQHPDYKDAAKKRVLWNKIANECGIISGEVAKAKWRNVRDSYVKHLKSLRIDNPKRKYNTWPWSDRMEFLIPYVTGRHNFVDSPDYQHSGHVKKEFWDEQGESLIQDEQGARAPHLVQQSDQQGSHMLRNFSTVDCLEGVKVELTDPTDLMMLSHARRIRGFSRKRQLQLEMKIARLVMEAEMEEVEAEEERDLTTGGLT